MKKHIFLLLSALVILVACKSQKKPKTNASTAGFFSYYNTIFNSKDALETEIRNRKESHKDNFYTPYISLLKFDDLSFDEGFGNISDENLGFNAPNRNQSKGASTLQITENKALKAISKYSVMKKGEEKNKKMFDAHLLLAQARIYQDKPLEALDALNFIFSNMKNDKRIDLAKIYSAYAYAKMGDFFRSEEIFANLENSGMKKKFQKLHHIYYAEVLLANGKKEQAVEELENAFTVNKNRELRSRIAFLRGQILSELGEKEQARESFATAYKYSNDFEFEVKSQIEIAKSFNQGQDDYEGAKKYIENISKKGIYMSRKNEFYYALGLMAKSAGKENEAQDFFRKAKELKISDPQIRGLTYYEIGKDFAEKNDYISAGAYYDSALAVMTYEPSKANLALMSKNIKDISKNYYLIKKNDSILALTKMPETERIAYFNKFIEAMKTKEAKEEAERKKEERSKGFGTEDYNANSIFASNKGNNFQDFSASGNKSTFYFSNQNTVAKGQSEFKQIWGNRSLVDNWRLSNRTASIEDVKNEALGISSVQNPRRFEPAFYIEQIPTDNEEILTLKKDRDTASLGLGRMYENYFSDTPLATKTLYDLVDNQPEEEVKLQALYEIFAMNYEKNPAAAERAKTLILNDFPYTHYAEFVKNPKSSNFSASSEEVETLYKKAFDLFETENFEESKTLISETVEKYPADALIPKFQLLNAFNTGKTAGKEIMILQLQQIALNYPKTDEGAKATQMLNYLKSDLEIETTDASGRKTTSTPSKPNQPKAKQNENKNQFPDDEPVMNEEEIQRVEAEMEKARKRDEEFRKQNRNKQ
ncbi:MAG: tetratricopeptide repeat protein [Cruoricaptor ignavus]|nr:tetratricopeptide repeat protein [Cruoricaptor ignavus]MDO5616186.1 tetratricopeptide repeat protein [Cruoricaptor ignavus]